MSESPRMSRKEVREYLGCGEGKLKSIVAQGILKPNAETGSFTRELVVAYGEKITQEDLNGRLGQTKEEMAGERRDWPKPTLVLRRRDTGRIGQTRRTG